MEPSTDCMRQARIEYFRRRRQEIRKDPVKYARVLTQQQVRFRRWWDAHAEERKAASEAKREAKRIQLEAEKAVAESVP